MRLTHRAVDDISTERTEQKKPDDIHKFIERLIFISKWNSYRKNSNETVMVLNPVMTCKRCD